MAFDVEDEVLTRPAWPVPTPTISASAEDLTPVAGVKPGALLAGAVERALTETLLAGGCLWGDRRLSGVT